MLKCKNFTHLYPKKTRVKNSNYSRLIRRRWLLSSCNSGIEDGKVRKTSSEGFGRPNPPESIDRMLYKSNSRELSTTEPIFSIVAPEATALQRPFESRCARLLFNLPVLVSRLLQAFSFGFFRVFKGFRLIF